MTTEHQADSAPPFSDPAMRRRVQISTFLGALLEWYDFYLYGFAAAVVFGPLFFPSSNAAVGVLASFATLAVGWIARPLGAVIFGHFGDRMGRRRVLVVTLLMMGVSSTLIGALPTADSAGILAPILLVALRLIQGISAGGEYAGAVLMTVEHAATRKRGLTSSVAQMGLYGGVLLANGALLIVSLLPDDQFLSWGWRLPFLASILLVGIALWIRIGIAESPAFIAVTQAESTARWPLAQLFRRHWRALVIVLLLVFGVATVSSFQGAFLASYAVALGFTTTEALGMTLVGTAVALVLLPIFASLSDRIGRKKVAGAGAVLMIAACWLAFILVSTGQVGLAVLGAALPPIAQSSVFGGLAAWISELFPTENRYGGVSIGYQTSVTLGAGLFPLIGTALLTGAGGAPHYGPVLGYVAAACVVTLIGVGLARETAHDTIAQIDGRGTRDVSGEDDVRMAAT